MTVTLNTEELHLDALDESFSYVSVEWDAWENQAYVRKTKVYGIIKRWTLTCHEYNVPWASSVAKHMQDTVLNAILPFVIDIQGAFSGDNKLHQIVSVNVKITGLTVIYDKTDSLSRRFTITVQAV